MSIDPEIAGRIQGGRFVPGVSGNPAGKPPGARARATRLAEKMMAGDAEAVLRDTRPGPACMTVQRQAQADRDACHRLLKAIFDRGLGQRQIARVTGIPLSTVQRALQRVIYPYRQDRPIEDAPTWKKRRAKLERVAIDQPAADPRFHGGNPGRIAPRKSRVTLRKMKVTRQWSCPHFIPDGSTCATVVGRTYRSGRSPSRSTSSNSGFSAMYSFHSWEVQRTDFGGVYRAAGASVGYSRAGKKDKLQIVFGLLRNRLVCPGTAPIARAVIRPTQYGPDPGREPPPSPPVP